MQGVQLMEILVIALARSGHHAVIHWLCKQLPGRVAYYNNCNHLLQWRNKSVYSNGVRPSTSHVYSFENFDISGFREIKLNGRFDKIIFVNRDPYNWLASSMARGGALSKPKKLFRPSEKQIKYLNYWGNSMTRLDMYIQYMKQCLNEEDYIGEPFYHINYNEWFLDKGYRKKLCDELGLMFSDEGMDHVPPRGSGSSFDGKKFRGRGSQMDVLNRWKSLQDNEEYGACLTDEIKEYSKKYFNFNPI